MNPPPPPPPPVSGDRATAADRRCSGIPKFKSIPPPSLPISPSSYFAIPPGVNPSELLDSPVLLPSSNLLPSPTTGFFVGQTLNWKSNSSINTQNHDEHVVDSQAIQSSIPSFATGGQKQEQNEQSSQVQSGNYNIKYVADQNCSYQLSQDGSEIELSKKSDDGYIWRKYGQKQVKGSENPRSYYKCTFPNCPMKKKIEKSLDNDQITEIAYKGSHNHPKPVSNTRGSGSSSSLSGLSSFQTPFSEFQDHSSFGSVPQGSSGPTDSVATTENSSISIASDKIDMRCHMSSSAGVGENGFYDGGGEDTEELDAKRWKGEVGDTECMSAAVGVGNSNKPVREPRVVVQTTSDIDILDDGYRWRKYGQKVVKGNPNPRSYYKCTHENCMVRKHIERAAHDPRDVITTYDGKHNHDVPAARGSVAHRANSIPNPNPPMPTSTSAVPQGQGTQLPPNALEMYKTMQISGFQG